LNVHILQHVAFEGPGCILDWLHERNATVQYVHLYASDPLPSPEQVDLLIIMGGPMSVNDEGIYPWLVEEKRFIQTIIASGKPVLGICLGAQLIASALGSRVYQGDQKEIGWFPLSTASSQPDCFQFPTTFTAFHWHGETFDLPEGVVRLASSPVCKNQAFQVGQNVIGLQFHLEATPETVVTMIEQCGDELVQGEYVQDAETIQQVDYAVYSDCNGLMFKLLAYLVPDKE